MSKKEWKRFRQDLKSNPELRRRFRQARRKAFQEMIAAFAGSAGYNISSEDFVKTPKKQPGEAVSET